MKWSKWLENWDMTGLKINLKFLEMEFAPSDKDKDAAWELYIELLTRIATQRLLPEHGDEATALQSIYSLFGITRETLKRNGRDCSEFTKIAIVVLNQVVRPFTAEWHKRSIAGDFDKPEACEDFRKALEALQTELHKYSRMLADMAGVEDLTALEQLEAKQA